MSDLIFLLLYILNRGGFGLGVFAPLFALFSFLTSLLNPASATLDAAPQIPRVVRKAKIIANKAQIKMGGHTIESPTTYTRVLI